MLFFVTVGIHHCVFPFSNPGNSFQLSFSTSTTVSPCGVCISRSNHTSKCQCHSHSQYNGITPHSVCGAKGLYQNRESQVKKLKWGEEDVKASKSDPIGYNVTRKRNRVLLISVSSCIIFKF